MSQRWTRKEIKKDEIAAFWERVIHFLQENLRSILWVAGGIAAAGLVALAVFLFSQHRAEEAQEALAAALTVAQAPIVADGAEPEDPEAPSFATEEQRDTRAQALFQEMYEKGGARGPGGVAVLFLASAASGRGDFDDARRLWSEYLEQGDGILASQVRLNLLDLDRQQGRTEEVIADLESMLGDDEKPLPGDVILYQLAVAYEGSGRDEDAQSQYQRIIEEYPQSAYRPLAQQAVAAAGGDLTATIGT